MHSRRSSSCVLAVVLVGLLSATSLLPAEPAEERTRPTGPPLEHAEDLVAVTVAGLESGGLIVCLDGEDGALAAAVSRGGKFLVQVLCSDAGRVAAVRKAIALHGLDGRVSAEHGSLKRLPYASSLVNVVVVEDFA